MENCLGLNHVVPGPLLESLELTIRLSATLLVLAPGAPRGASDKGDNPSASHTPPSSPWPGFLVSSVAEESQHSGTSQPGLALSCQRGFPGACAWNFQPSHSPLRFDLPRSGISVSHVQQLLSAVHAVRHKRLMVGLAFFFAIPPGIQGTHLTFSHDTAQQSLHFRSCNLTLIAEKGGQQAEEVPHQAELWGVLSIFLCWLSMSCQSPPNFSDSGCCSPRMRTRTNHVL